MRRNVPRLPKVSIVLAFCGALAFGQSQPNVKQESKNSSCSNIVALAGNVDVNCSALSPDQQRVIDGIPAILHKILKYQTDPSVVMKKLDDIRSGVDQIREQETFSGFLTPGNDPVPYNACGGNVPSGATLVIVGNSASYSTWSPSTVIEINDDKMLVMEKIGGRVAISAKLFSSDGKMVAELIKNQFFINPNNYFRKEVASDGHSLTVYDQGGLQVLNVRFINENTVAFLGIIRHPSRDVEISTSRDFFANGMCAGQTEIAFHFGVK